MPAKTIKAKPKTEAVYRYDPVLFDALRENSAKIPVGTRLVKMHPGYGAPKNGTMGMCYVEDADTGVFYGLVMLKSLVADGRRPVS